MKKNLLKSCALFTMLLCAVNLWAASGIDWSSYNFLADGAGNGKYANKYKVQAVEGLAVVNIQKPVWAAEDGIYMHVPAAITECNVKSKIDGAGIVLYLSSFTAKETQVTLKYNAGTQTCSFWVYFVDGTDDTPGTPDTPDTPDTPGTPDTPDTPEDLQSGACSGTAKGVDTYYTNADPTHAITSLTQGFTWKAETTAKGVNITVQFLDNLPGIASPYLLRFDSEGLLMGGDVQMSGWDATKRIATHTLTGLSNGDELTFLVKVALEAGKVLFTERITYVVGSSCDQTSIELPQTQQEIMKVIKDGQLIIINNGVYYNAMGVQINH